MENKKDQLIITRVFDAPRELVWEAWTKAEHVKHWWGPTVFTNPVCEINAVPDGHFIIHMRSPDGIVFIMDSTYKEVTEPERLVFLSVSKNAAGHAIMEQINTVLFVQEGGKTKVTMQIDTLSCKPEYAGHLQGMSVGINQGLDKLANYLNNRK